MKFSRTLSVSGTATVVAILVLTNAATIRAAPSPKPKPNKLEPSKDERARNVERLKKAFYEDDPDFERVAEEVQRAGVPAQTIVELRLVAYIRLRRQTLNRLPAVLNQLEQMLPSWKPEELGVFESKSDLEASMSFARAILAAEAGDDAEFEHWIYRALGLDPDLGSVLGQEVKSYRQKKRLASVIVPMDTELETSIGGKTTITKLARGQKALLLNFLRSWCLPVPVIQVLPKAMPEVWQRAGRLAAQKVAVVGITIDLDSQNSSWDPDRWVWSQRQSEASKKEHRATFPLLLDPRDQGLCRLLVIDSVPRAVLIDAEGHLLYDGDPDDPGITAALAKIGVSLED